jgi:hypothetical protein
VPPDTTSAPPWTGVEVAAVVSCSTRRITGRWGRGWLSLILVASVTEALDDLLGAYAGVEEDTVVAPYGS